MLCSTAAPTTQFVFLFHIFRQRIFVFNFAFHSECLQGRCRNPARGYARRIEHEQHAVARLPQLQHQQGMVGQTMERSHRFLRQRIGLGEKWMVAGGKWRHRGHHAGHQGRGTGRPLCHAFRKPHVLSTSRRGDGYHAALPSVRSRGSSRLRSDTRYRKLSPGGRCMPFNGPGRCDQSLIAARRNRASAPARAQSGVETG